MARPAPDRGRTHPILLAPTSAQAPLLLCLSHLRWDFVFQRPQHLLSRAAKTHRVVFFEEPMRRPPGADLPRLDRHVTPSGVEVAVPILPDDMDDAASEAAQRTLLDGLLAGARPDIAWYYTPMSLGFTSHLQPAVTVYDCMDELSAFRGASPQLTLLERRLLRQADIVFTGGRSLYEAKLGLHPRVHQFTSGVDAAHFARSRALRAEHAPEPADQAGLPHPRIGWFGVIDERMDLDLLDQVAALRPGWSFVMVGPVVKIDPASLPTRPNIHWLGGRKMDELPAYLAGWDCGLMNFALNESTRFISPTKTPEYLAAGVPVVSTPITDVVRSWGAEGLVGIASDAAGIVAEIESAMARPQASWLPKADRLLAQGSWDSIWSSMHELLRQAAARKPIGDGPVSSRAVASPNHV